MFICICTGLDEKKLKELCQEGTDTLSKVMKSCGAGGDCGTCAFKINRLIKQYKSEDGEPSSVESADKSSAQGY